jgi:hypothetical protein
MPFPTPSALYEYYHRIPTTDLYFRQPIRCLREQGQTLPPIRHLGRNIYAIGRTGVICRYATTAELDRLQSEGVRQIVYIADDDFAAGADDADLPAPYRAKLRAFVEGSWPRLKEAADTILVSSPALLSPYGVKARLVEPVWHAAPSDLEHFSAPGRIEIAHLGTGSHAADIASIAPALASVLAIHPHVRLTLVSAAGLPDSLRDHARIRIRRPLPWWAYKRALPRMRFHLALYPLRQNRVNEARSANKLYEHALAGAASLLSRNPALEAAGNAIAGLFVETRPDAWRERIEEDLANLAACQGRAERTRGHILSRGVANAMAAQWLEILGPGT